MKLTELDRIKAQGCTCGRAHTLTVSLDNIYSGAGALNVLPEVVARYNAKRAFVLADKNTRAAAGARVCTLLKDAGVAVTTCTFPEDAPEPNEHNVGLAMMYFSPDCDVIIGIGSGVVNDIGKIVSAVSGKPYIIVATAPSMDGYASASSSMTREGLKISLPSRAADAIIGDTDILCAAPLKLMKSGLGDMLAKYVSICEWRISHLVTGEYYCEEIANLVRVALKRCTDHADGLLRRDPQAVTAVFEGLVIGGLAMNYAGVSRPASGIEHYFSHVWDMRGVEFGTPVELHGLQCAVGTLLATRIYEKLKTISPNRDKALAAVSAFDFTAWAEQLRAFLGKGAESMIALEEKEQKYNKEKHEERLTHILENWDAILQIIDEELPSSVELEALLDRIEAPKSMEELGIDPTLYEMSFLAAKDIRDKYVLPRLTWDLGISAELFSSNGLEKL